MITLAAPLMAKKPANVCTYKNVRLDDEVLPLVVAAAALKKQTIQDYLSDLANADASAFLGRPPIHRRPSPPKPHGPGRPKGYRPAR